MKGEHTGTPGLHLSIVGESDTHQGQPPVMNPSMELSSSAPQHGGPSTDSDGVPSGGAPKPRKPRKPRISRDELEQAAYVRGYEEGLGVPGGDVIGVICGALSGALAVGILWTLVHFFG